MPPLPVALSISPHVDTQGTPLQVGTGIVASQRVRVKNGYLEKMGGCQHLCDTPLVGTARALMGWQDANGNTYIGIGTSATLEVMNNCVLWPIGPVAHTSNLALSALSVTSGSATVTATDGGYTPAVGQQFLIVNATYVGGIYLQGLYTVLTLGGGGTFTFAAATRATSTTSTSNVVVYTSHNATQNVTLTLGAHVFSQNETLTVGIPTDGTADANPGFGYTLAGDYNVVVTGGPTYTIQAPTVAANSETVLENQSGGVGRIRVAYLTFIAPEAAPSGAYSTGPYGAGAYGVGGGASNVPTFTQWTLALWGSPGILLAARAGATIYEWTPPPADENYATVVSGAPSAVNGIVVATPQQQIVAWGIYSGALGEQDPLLIGFCDVGNRTVWTAAVNNQAGTFRITSGSIIVACAWFGTTGLIWTDVGLWSMIYNGYPLVYGFNEISRGCGLISQRAWALVRNRVAWLSQEAFFVYQGGNVAPLTCSVRDFIFQSIDRAYAGAIHADANSYFGEITWRFPTSGSKGVCNAWVTWHADEAGPNGEPVWTFGSGAPYISAWTDQFPPGEQLGLPGAPVGSDNNGLLQQFETAIDFDGQVLDASFRSGWFQLAEGGEMLFLERIRWDFTLSGGGQVQCTVFVSDELPLGNAEVPVRTYGPYAVNANTPYSIVRARGRFASVQVQIVAARTSPMPNTFWRYGKPLAVVQIDGRR